MKTWMTLLTGLCMLLVASQAWTEPSPDSDGRYEGIAASANAVWVIDTQTGKVRKCTQEFADQKPICTAFSD